MIHELENDFVVSSNGMWIAGVYATKRAAHYAFRFDNYQLQKLQDEKNKTTKVITFEDLQKLRKTLLK